MRLEGKHLSNEGHNGYLQIANEFETDDTFSTSYELSDDLVDGNGFHYYVPLLKKFLAFV